jgi:hypothetical protein|tara:strand:+ start:1446 stop:2528 length:1083 start_codon:yes stop_codon:yes gene_type:complete
MAYTTIDDGSAYFQTATWTGNGSTQSITNGGNSDLQPDWIWTKRRNGDGQNHHGIDSTRGASKAMVINDVDGEATKSNGITAFNSDGFSVGTDTNFNNNTTTYVGWQWKANGGTTTTNDASATSVGSIDSVYQANTTAGFSIVTYTGTGSNGTIAHGLGSTPKWYFVKNRSESSISGTGQSWIVYHSVMAHGAAMFLNTDDSKMNHSPFWNSTAPTSTTFSVGTDSRTNTSGDDYIAYCFAEKQGYSKFGSYVGNANADGPFVYTGFKPAWVMTKNMSNAGGWAIMDTGRSPFNVINEYLIANTADTESSGQDFDIDSVSNGFKVRYTNGNYNANGSTIIYMAFAEHPFVSSKGVPTTAR